MANWSNPTLTSTYTNFLSELKARDSDLALQFDGTTSTNLTTGTIRWDSSANRWKKWNGTSWAELATTYALTGLSTTGGAAIGGTLQVSGAATLATATATTPATGDNSTAVATTAYVQAQAYATLASPALTGTPTVPSAAADTNTTQAASTAFVLGQAGSTAPVVNGTAAAGTSLRYSRQDHVHPSDTSRAPLASPTFTGVPAAPTAALGTDTTQLATTAFVQAEIANDAPTKTGTGASGTWSIAITGNAGTATTLATARTINGTSFNGSANITITANTPQALTGGSYITSTGTFDGSTARTFAVDATNLNTASKVVARDASGNFSAGTITASLTGTASGNLALTGGTLSGALIGAAGTVSAPALAVGEAGTGLYRPSAGVMAFSTSGSEGMRLDSGSRLLLGASSSLAMGGNGVSLMQVETTTGFALSCTTNSADTVGTVVALGKSRGTTPGSVTAVAAGDTLADLRFGGADGFNRTTFATSIRGFVDGTVATGDIPGRISFHTQAVGGALGEVMRLTSDKVIAYNQGAPTIKSTLATLTFAELKTGIIQYTGNAQALTLPTGTLMEGAFNTPYANMTFDFSVINAGTGICTVTSPGTSNQLVGSGAVAIGDSGRFATRRTAANSFITYRLA